MCRVTWFIQHRPGKSKQPCTHLHMLASFYQLWSVRADTSRVVVLWRQLLNEKGGGRKQSPPPPFPTKKRKVEELYCYKDTCCWSRNPFCSDLVLKGGSYDLAYCTPDVFSCARMYVSFDGSVRCVARVCVYLRAIENVSSNLIWNLTHSSSCRLERVPVTVLD